MKKSARPREGTCKLTGIHGRLVDSHLIPLALTRLSRTGQKYIEAGIGLGTKSRSNSWYDGQLVTGEGEGILAAIDARGIEVLRRCKLVWSGWSADEDLAAEFAYSEQGVGIREIQVAQAEDLQLFFLSLLWRAAASTRHEFADVNLPATTLEDLRLRVLHQSPGAFEDYPVQLFQLTTRGVEHNRTPLIEHKRMPLTTATGWGNEVEYARFYFDGLTSHIHLPQRASMEPEYLRSCLGLRPGRGTIVFGHKFEESRAWENIKEMTITVTREERTPPSKTAAIARAAREYLDTSLQTRRPDEREE
jgi:hypothetical protein